MYMNIGTIGLANILSRRNNCFPPIILQNTQKKPGNNSILCKYRIAVSQSQKKDTFLSSCSVRRVTQISLTTLGRDHGKISHEVIFVKESWAAGWPGKAGRDGVLRRLAMERCADRMTGMCVYSVCMCVLGRVSRLSIEAEFEQLKEFLTAFFLPWKTPIHTDVPRLPLSPRFPCSARSHTLAN